MKVIVTGSSGLIGSAAVEYFDRIGFSVFCVDNNMQREFFVTSGDTTWNLERQKNVTRNFRRLNLDICDWKEIFKEFEDNKFGLIVHCAAQPSQDRAADIPLFNFDVNAVGTINLLEATRNYCPDAVFIHMSTNKVYGDAPNELPFKELPSRWEYARPEDYNGIR